MLWRDLQTDPRTDEQTNKTSDRGAIPPLRKEICVYGSHFFPPELCAKREKLEWGGDYRNLRSLAWKTMPVAFIFVVTTTTTEAAAATTIHTWWRPWQGRWRACLCWRAGDCPYYLSQSLEAFPPKQGGVEEGVGEWGWTLHTRAGSKHKKFSCKRMWIKWWIAVQL